MILIFLGNGRMTLIAMMSIPLAILCSLVGLFATGNTINAMTLGGLALAIGPLVDNAIVVLENTHRHHTLGKSPIAAAFDGAAEVTMPVLVATLTTIIVLCPIAIDVGHGRLLVPAADARSGLRDARVVRLVADARARAVRQMAQERTSMRAKNMRAALGQSNPPSHRSGDPVRHPAL